MRGTNGQPEDGGSADNEPDGRVASLVFRPRRAISGGADLPGSVLPQVSVPTMRQRAPARSSGVARCGLPAVAGGDGAAARFAPGRGCCQYGVVEAGGAARIVIVPPPAGRAAPPAPADAISVLALRDVIVILPSCAVDYPPLNDGRCTPLRIEITPPAPACPSRTSESRAE